MKTAGLILAGGKSNRLGEHKFQKKLCEISLLDRVASRLSVQIDHMAVNLPRGCTSDEYKVLYEPEESAGKLGPLAGVLLGLNWAKAIGADALITVPVDVPFFPNKMTDHLVINALGKTPVCALADNQRHGLCTLWPVDCLSAFDNAFSIDGVRTVNRMLDILMVKEVKFETGEYPQFFNINTAADIGVAEEIIEKNSSST